MKRVYIATGITAVIGGLITAALVPSCDGECTLEARPSAVVQFIAFTDSDSAPKQIAASEVLYEFTDDAGTVTTLRAEQMDDEATEWILGYERPGTYTVKATVCGQKYEERVVAEMEEDGCHVKTEWAQIEVDASTCGLDVESEDDYAPPTVCTHEARYSVIVDVLGGEDENGRGIPLATDSRYFKWSEDADQRKWPGTCLNPECSQFAVGLEQAGRFEIGAEVCGHAASTFVEVEETKDGCHVDTQRVVLRLDDEGCDDKRLAVDASIDTQCELQSHPSAILLPVTVGDDYWKPHKTDLVWYEHDDTRHKAYCAGKPDDDGKCDRWIAGWDLPGNFTAYTEKCGKDSSVSYKVFMDDNGCHAETVYVPIFIDETGCIQAPHPESKPIPVIKAPEAGGSEPELDLKAPEPPPIPDEESDNR